MKTIEKITIPKNEYDLLKIYEEDIKAITKFLAINHSDIYMSIINFKMERVKQEIKELK